MTSSPPRKQFTVDEANQTLPLVRAIVSDIVQQAANLADRSDRLARIRKLRGEPQEDDPYHEEIVEIEEQLKKNASTLQEFVDELRELGVEFKDHRRGLVDFPAVIDGRDVYLCWQLGEEELAYWHEVDAGFEGRQSLLEKSVTSEEPTDQGD